MAYVINFGEGGNIYANFLGNGGSVIPDPGPGPDPDPGQDDPSELTDEEKALKSDALARIAKIKEQFNAGDEVMLFGFITDLHSMYTREQALADASISDAVKADWPSNDDSYYGHSCERSLRLLGSLSKDLNADAVFCGGDMSSGRLSFDQYDVMLGKVRQLFDKYISVPHFTVEGNHDRRYRSSVRCRTNAEWLTYLKSFNTPGWATYLEDGSPKGKVGDADYDPGYGLSKYGYVGNTYYVDFPSKKVRVVMLSQYEKHEQESSYSMDGLGPYWLNLYRALRFDNPEDAEEWTVMTVSHFITNASTTNDIDRYYMTRYLDGGSFGAVGATERIALPSLNGGHKGRAVVGGLFGHRHNFADYLDSDNKLKFMMTGSASSSYLFSIFALNLSSYKLYEVKVGIQGNTGSLAFRSDASVSPYGWFEYDIRHS